ncbi:MAG TPA: triple tyrosine motif-containing protein [Saprospiraceae bacterium]|nr:triple tyrosine motif-containing protein [Saprospiraceae bacterium]
MKLFFIGVLFSTLINQHLIAQDKEKLFSILHPSQNSNNYIYTSPRHHLTFLSSTDGLNVYDGQHIKTYRESTHSMLGYNIQSNFFEDKTGLIWFTTYEALNVFDPIKDEFKYHFMVNSCGDTLKDNYKAFWLDGQNLYLKAGTEFFVFDVYSGKIVTTYGLNLSDYFELACLKSGLSNTIVYGNISGLHSSRIYPDGSFNLLHSTFTNVSTIYPCDMNSVWLGTFSGVLIRYFPNDNSFRDSISIVRKPITGITRNSNDEILVSSSGKLYNIGLQSKVVNDSILPLISSTRGSVKYLNVPYMDNDSTLWICAEGKGTLFCNLKKVKFKHWLSTVSVTKIFKLESGEYIVFTHNSGIYQLDHTGEVIRQWNKLPDQKENFTSLTSVQTSASTFLFSYYNQLFRLDLKKGTINELIQKSGYSFRYIAQLNRLQNGKIITSIYKNMLFEITLSNENYTLTPYLDCSSLTRKTTFFEEAPNQSLILSNDEVNLLVFKYNSAQHKHQYAFSLAISGGIRTLTVGKHLQEIYLGNSVGLFKIDLDKQEQKQIIDLNFLLLQTIYSSLTDRYGNLWLGTNHGLVKYYTVNEESKSYSIMDGIQDLEYNTHASLLTTEGEMLFGGVNGINYFIPDKVHPSEMPAPVYISEILINDEPDTTYDTPHYIDSLILPYSRNTISFAFHSIDNGDPEATRARYILKGSDQDTLDTRSADGFARYANLKPGLYTFSVWSRNSDGFLSSKPREISIKVGNPYWMTWWFITIVVGTSILIIYYFVRAYYKRKLERSNQMLREQALIIEKQQAIESERTRIAAEMHDDLGSGLTTIRYLSDKALKGIQESKEINQIKRIADQSNMLIHKMSEIIWAMNSRYDNTEELIGYLRRYASEYLEEYQLPVEFIVPDYSIRELSIGGEKRRNIFMVFKETLHNTVKHAHAKSIRIMVEVNKRFMIHISEIGGTGFDPTGSIDKGNGLYNSNKRIKAIHGEIKYEKMENSMDIHISIPLEV